MLSIRSTGTVLLMGSLAASVVGSASANDVVRISDRCALYGAGYVDVGNGTCGQVGHLRVGEAAHGTSWGATSNAGLRSDGLGMLPGAGNARHLRIQADPDFR